MIPQRMVAAEAAAGVSAKIGRAAAAANATPAAPAAVFDNI
jgi:hypothetical protein